MKRTKKKQGQLKSGLPLVGEQPVTGGKSLESTRRPAVSSRRNTGRLGRAIKAAAGKSSPPAEKKELPAKAEAKGKNDSKGTAPRDVPENTSQSAPVLAKSIRKSAKKAPSKHNYLAILGPDGSRQGQAEAFAKSSRIQRAGFESRIRGHVSASGKRAQGRRDSKQK